LASRLVISQPEAVSNIAVPTFETRLAVQMTVNAAWLNGPQREGAGSVGAAAAVRSALKLFSTARWPRGKAFERPYPRLVNHSRKTLSATLPKLKMDRTVSVVGCIGTICWRPVERL
jgi:hypothetical protein